MGLLDTGDRVVVAVQQELNVFVDGPDVLALCEENNLASLNRSPLGGAIRVRLRRLRTDAPSRAAGGAAGPGGLPAEGTARSGTGGGHGHGGGMEGMY